MRPPSWRTWSRSCQARASITGITVRRVDMVEATTNVEVRYELPRTAPASGRVAGSVEGGA